MSQNIKLAKWNEINFDVACAKSTSYIVNTRNYEATGPHVHPENQTSGTTPSNRSHLNVGKKFFNGIGIDWG